MRALVVEDDPNVGPDIARALTAAGFAVDLARDGKGAGNGMRWRVKLRFPCGKQGCSLIRGRGAVRGRAPVLVKMVRNANASERSPATVEVACALT